MKLSTKLTTVKENNIIKLIKKKKKKFFKTAIFALIHCYDTYKLQ